MKAKRKQFAVLHDGTFEGDSMFYVECGPSTSCFWYKGETLDQLKEKFRKILQDDGFDDEESIEEYVKAVKGAWILDSKGLDAIAEATDQCPGNDSAVYAINRTAKRICQSLAVKVLGKRAR